VSITAAAKVHAVFADSPLIETCVLNSTELISQSTAGLPANTNNNDRPTIPNHGCRLVFKLAATNLIDGFDFGSNSSRHVFLSQPWAA